METAVNEALAACLGTVMKDEPWQDFGFSRRPRHGAWFARFRSKWRVELENAVLQEMLSVLTAAYICADRLPADAANGAAALYTSNQSITAAFGFASQVEGQSFFKTAIEAYASSPQPEWATLLFARIRPDQVPDKKLRAKLFVGCAQFANTATRMVGYLKWQAS